MGEGPPRKRFTGALDLNLTGHVPPLNKDDIISIPGANHIRIITDAPGPRIVPWVWKADTADDDAAARSNFAI
jgi:hypothetical protein